MGVHAVESILFVVGGGIRLPINPPAVF